MAMKRLTGNKLEINPISVVNVHLNELVRETHKHALKLNKNVCFICRSHHFRFIKMAENLISNYTLR